jgi:hypothetical protein
MCSGKNTPGNRTTSGSGNTGMSVVSIGGSALFCWIGWPVRR